MYIAKTKVSYPITLANSYVFVNEMLSRTSDDDNSEFTDMLIESATEATEGQINQDIAYTGNVITLKDFIGSELKVAQGNFNSMTSIVNNDTSTLITGYEVVKGYDYFLIVFDSTISCDKMTLSFNTGWNNIDDVPKCLRQAILVKTADLWDNERGSYNFSGTNYNNAWERLCDQYKLM